MLTVCDLFISIEPKIWLDQSLTTVVIVLPLLVDVLILSTLRISQSGHSITRTNCL